MRPSTKVMLAAAAILSTTAPPAQDAVQAASCCQNAAIFCDGYCYSYGGTFNCYLEPQGDFFVCGCNSGPGGAFGDTYCS
jgi:hypothetical protein